MSIMFLSPSMEQEIQKMMAEAKRQGAIFDRPFFPKMPLQTVNYGAVFKPEV
jgi:hypothetical protein